MNMDAAGVSYPVNQVPSTPQAGPIGSYSAGRIRESQSQVKRLIVFSDGTWQTPENKIPTNILKLTKAVKLESEDRTQQVIFYDAGIGTEGAIQKVVGGGFGEGIDINIMELYTFLCLNYDDGDEVYLFGFSRGSYTVRSLAGLIRKCGLVRRSHIDFVKEAYDLYRADQQPESEEATAFKEEHGNTIPITLLACFDTVGSLGLPPNIKTFGPLDRYSPEKYKFHDTTLTKNILNAIHIMSIDEDREIFAPTRMEYCEELGPDQLTQLYFPGGHGGVGGGDEKEEPLSDNCLHFLVHEIKRRGMGIAFDMDLIPRGNVDIEPVNRQPSRLFQFIEGITGKHVRQISSTDELHMPSVATRYQRQPDWRPKALEHLHDEICEYEV